ncbi:MAG: diacylglycerol kinase family protein [Anaerolineales bacterium]
MTAKQKRAWLIYNPDAGRFPAGPLLPRAMRIFAEAGWSVDVKEGHNPEQLRSGAAEAAKEGLDAVFVAGGDGTVGLAADALAGSDTALGVLPSGTANVWAQEIGLPRLTWATPLALDEAARRLATGSVRDVDLGTCNGHSFLLWAGIGLDGKVVNSIGPRQPWTRAFVAAQHTILAFWEAMGWTGLELRVDALNQRWEGRFVVAVASNIRAYAGGLLELSPEAKVDDGLLEFWLLKGSSMRDVVGWVMEILLGQHVDDPNVTYFKADEAIFSADQPLPMQLDGEPHEAPNQIRFGVRHRAVRMLVPQGGWPDLFSQDTARGQEVSE